MVKENLAREEIQEVESFNYTGVRLVSGNLYVDPTVLADPKFVSEKLQALLGITKENADFYVSKRPLRYVKILRRMNLATKDYVDLKLQDEKQAIQKGLTTEEAGISNFIILEPNPTRFYPEKNMG